MKTHIN